MFDHNIKVHFAGSDGEEIFYAALTAAQTRYRLYSCYKFILNKNPDEDFTLPENHVLKVQDYSNRHVIQDSGLFTLMFGASKGTKQTRESLEQWQDKLIAFVQQNNLKATCVEIDCQKVLGVEDAWYFRQRMRDKLKNRQINVFHFEDGKKGLERLIEFSDYIAISVPEMRIVKPKTFRKDVHQLLFFIKQRKPEIDIHLLGCTDYKMLRENNFCTSADSTTWLQGVKYGYVKYSSELKHIREFGKDLLDQRRNEVKKILDERKIELKPKTLEYSTNASICATICKQSYIKVAGDQE